MKFSHGTRGRRRCTFVHRYTRLQYRRAVWSKLKCLVERGVPVRPMSSDCACGHPRHDHTRAFVHPDGWDVSCLRCGARWIEWRLSDTFESRRLGC